MKKILAMLMALVLCTSLCACSQAHAIGETVEVQNLSYTITDVQIAASVKHGDNTQDDFFTPAGTGELEFSAPGGSTLLCFTAQYTYTGSTIEDSDIAKDVFVPIVKCKGGRFDNNYMIFMREQGGDWYNLSSDISWEARKNYGLGLSTLSFDLEPESNTVYEIRGCIYIPLAAAEDTASKINLYMDTVKFSVR